MARDARVDGLVFNVLKGNRDDVAHVLVKVVDVVRRLKAVRVDQELPLGAVHRVNEGLEAAEFGLDRVHVGLHINVVDALTLEQKCHQFINAERHALFLFGTTWGRGLQ